MTSGIYQISSPSGKRYIGSSTDVNKRWTKHKYQLSHNKHHSRHLQNAWNKFEGHLEFQLLVICEPKDLLFYEQLIIDNFKPEYNIAQYADKANYALGIKRSEETKDKIRQAHLGKPKKGHPQTEKSKAKLSKALKNNKNGLGNKANLGRKLPEITCQRMREAWAKKRAQNDSLKKMAN